MMMMAVVAGYKLIYFFPSKVMKIDRYKERVDNMLFRVTFNEKHQQLSQVCIDDMVSTSNK